MNPYWVIGILILVFGCVFSYSYARYQRDRLKDEAWLYVALLAVSLEVEARKARDRQRAKDASPTADVPELPR